MKNLSEILEMEKAVAATICDVKKSMVEEIENTPIERVKPLAKNMVVVRLSCLKDNVWSPEYYMPSVQAGYVQKALENVSTAHVFFDIVNKMIKTRCVKIGPNVYKLNEQTVLILNKYVAE